MYKIEFTLKQHTPIIHFQHNQEGATLRATEVKPKLDRFLIEKFAMTTIVEVNGKAKEIPKDEYLKWFSNNDALSLNYKIRFAESQTNWEQDVTIIPPNIDKALKKDDFQIYFHSYLKELLDEIENYIMEFFILTNFGRRQNKGFGCFYIDGTSRDSFLTLDRMIFQYTGNGFVNHDTNFYNTISKQWRILKSGSNRPYKKSRVFKYMFLKGMRWEKRWFKVLLNDWINDPTNTDPEYRHQLLCTNEPLDVSEDENEDNNNNGYYNYADNPDFNDDYFFGRAFLGLAEHFEFRTTRNDRIYQFKVKSDVIARFKGPVTFKVFNNYIFAIVEKIPKQLKNQNFTFDLIVKNPQNNRVIARYDDFTDLNTPPTFSLKRFLADNFSFVNFDLIEN